MRTPFLVFPFLAAFSASAGAADVVTLQANRLQAAFDLGDMGGIVSLRHGDAEVVTADWAAPTVFAIGVVSGNNSRYFTNRDFDSFESERIDGGLRLRYGGLKGKKLDVELTIRETDGAIDFKSAVRCGPDTICSDLLYPYVSGYESLSGDPEKDVYLLPMLCGQIFPNPARALREGKPDMLGGEGYPGTQCVQMHALYDGQSGFVMWTPDAECHPKRFTMRRDDASGGLAWCLMHYFDETPGFVFEQPYGVRVQACGPSWYDASDIYAEWGRRQWWMEKKKLAPDWFKKLPPLANVHDNEHWTRNKPMWIAEHQPEMNALLGNRPLINTFQQWEGPGHWIAPDSFPPIGGEEAMIEAGKKIRAMGNHLKHMFSCGEYWLHPGLSDEYLETTIMGMAALPRGWTNPQPPKKYFQNIGYYVYCDPSSEAYQQRLVDYVDKLCDYSHDFISMDIWPLGQPRVCHNPALPHPPGLGKWYVDANIELLKKMHAAVYARQPEAIFGGESMTEPYMPWMHATVMRSVMAPVNRDKKGRIDFIRIPLFNYIYGDQVRTWDNGPMTEEQNARMDLCLQLARGNLIGITDKWHHKYFDTKAMGMAKNYQTGDPIGPPVLKGIKLGGPELRKANLEFAAMLNDIQNGEFHDYFANGRGWRQPQGFAKSASDKDWRGILIYDRNPAVGALQREGSDNILWVLANGRDEQAATRLLPLEGRKVLQNTLKNEPKKIEHDGRQYLEILLDPCEVAFLEWGK